MTVATKLHLLVKEVVDQGVQRRKCDRRRTVGQLDMDHVCSRIGQSLDVSLQTIGSRVDHLGIGVHDLLHFG